MFLIFGQQRYKIRANIPIFIKLYTQMKAQFYGLKQANNMFVVRFIAYFREPTSETLV